MIYWLFDKAIGYYNWQVEDALKEGRLTENEYTLIEDEEWESLKEKSSSSNMCIVNDPVTNRPMLVDRKPIEWKHTLDRWDMLTPDELKRKLFSELLYHFKGDDIRNGYDESRPLCSLTRKGTARNYTVDGAKEVYVQYLGDDDDYARKALSVANVGKDYIRMVVSQYKGVTVYRR